MECTHLIFYADTGKCERANDLMFEKILYQQLKSLLDKLLAGELDKNYIYVYMSRYRKLNYWYVTVELKAYTREDFTKWLAERKSKMERFHAYYVEGMKL